MSTKPEIIEVITSVWQCADCGAYSRKSPDAIRHFPKCDPGSSERWRKFYDQDDESP